MRGNYHWTDIEWVVRAIDEDQNEWVREMGECQQCHKPSDHLFVCHKIEKQYCDKCIRAFNLVTVLL